LDGLNLPKTKEKIKENPIPIYAVDPVDPKT
jgi:hypothetical protein